MGSRPTILVVLGTRPEVVKLAPVVRALRMNPATSGVRVLFTSQHRDLAPAVAAAFNLVPDYDLDLMSAGQSPAQVTARVLERIEPVLDALSPHLVVVQGDTTTAMAAAMAAFYRKIPVAHVEAGLRTDSTYNPFPEEMNRRLITRLATLHFAATEANRAALLAEGVPPDTIHVTGNPVIDAVEWILTDQRWPLLPIAAHVHARGNRLLLLTTHRRENFGAPQRNIFRAVRAIVDARPDVEFVFPVHPNPAVLETVRDHLPDHPRIHRIAPLEYPDFIHLMAVSYMVLTDSGGLQEEAPALGKPTLVLRTTTEREEMITAGSGRLVGVETDDIVTATCELLDDADIYNHMSVQRYPFGVAGASAGITEIIARWLRTSPAPAAPARRT